MSLMILEKLLIEIINSGAEGIILDLRNNPGGLLNRTIDIAGWFLEKGQVVLTEQDKNLEKPATKPTVQPVLPTFLPLSLLTKELLLRLRFLRVPLKTTEAK